jgi:pimeloyl-ACP methyl ester carboxylesterase
VHRQHRYRHGNAPGEPRFDAIEHRHAERPPIAVPSVILGGAEDTVGPPHRSERHLALFPPGTERPGGGQSLAREQPAAVGDTMLNLLARPK